MSIKKRNPQDATLRNIRAASKAIVRLTLALAALNLRVAALERQQRKRR